MTRLGEATRLRPESTDGGGDLGLDPPAQVLGHRGGRAVALIGIDRSIAAWTLLTEHLPEEKDSILDILVLLARVRKHTEKDFPKARAFIRPGFDTEGKEE